MIAVNRVTIATFVACAAMPGMLNAQQPTMPPPAPAPAELPDDVGAAAGTADTASIPTAGPPTGVAPDMGMLGEINQGTVTIRADSISQVTIYRQGFRVGPAPAVVKQREGTKRWYEVRDTNGAVMCGDTIAIEEPYQQVERVCRPGNKRLTVPLPQPKSQ